MEVHQIMDYDVDYNEFIGSDFMKSLTDTNDIRIEEEMSRPKVEVWPEDFAWQQWVSMHDDRRRTLLCSLQSMRATPYCAVGYH